MESGMPQVTAEPTLAPNAVLFVPVPPAPTFGYADVARVTVRPGVFDAKVPDTPVALAPPMLRTVSLPSIPSPGSTTPSPSPPESTAPVAECTSDGEAA